MTELSKLLEDRGIRKAVVIDDVFDAVPRPDELDDGDWSTFFDDLSEADHQYLTSLIPEYKETDRSDLQVSQEFITVLWQNRKSMSAKPLFEALFKDYEYTNANDKEGINTLLGVLKGLGLSCTTMGRELDKNAREADLIFVDLFLGSHQSDDDMQHAISRVSEIVGERSQSPPLVILMSKSSRLPEKRNQFRDDAGLLGTTFRVVRKADLAEKGMLETMLTRLAKHYEDAKRVAEFVYAWDSGLNRAHKNFIRILRRLDLPDLAQIRALLLVFSGQMLGEYLLDVADRVLQHEIEGDENTIKAALELNNIDLDKYPAPHLAGSPDLQDLVYRMFFLHSDRLHLSKKKDILQIRFGDVLRWKSEDGVAFCDDVSLVVTPACDLMRNRVKCVMLLSGKLENLEPKDWSYRADSVRTPVVILSNEDRKWIKWDLKNIKMLSWIELELFLSDQKRLMRIGRLRELYANEIQQKMLADIGRIGRPANLPVPFPVDVSFFYVDVDSKAQKFNVEQIESATCYVGRDADSKPVHRLVLTEQTCDHIGKALQSMADDVVHSSARESLTIVKGDHNFLTRFERGEITIPANVGSEKKIPEDNNKVHAVIIRGGNFSEGSKVKGNIKKAALIIKVTDMLEDYTN